MASPTQTPQPNPTHNNPPNTFTAGFAEPVPRDYVAYYAVVLHPLDLGTLRARVAASVGGGEEEGEGLEAGMFVMELRQVFHNALFFNEAGSGVHR